MATSIPLVSATWPQWLDLLPPPLPTSNQKTSVSFCQLPEPPITNRNIPTPFREEPSQPLLQLPAHRGQILAITLAPDPPAQLPQPRSCFSAAPVIFVFGFPIAQLIIFHPALPCLAAGRRSPLCWEVGRGGNVGVPSSPQEAAQLQMCKRREKKMLETNEMKKKY